MPIVGEPDLRTLIEYRGPQSVTIQITTFRAGRDTRQNAISAQNALADTEKQLCELGLKEAEARAYLEEANTLFLDDTFWRHQGDGLVLYIGPDRMWSYRLPFGVPTLVHVGSRFLVKPLLKRLGRNRRFYILALSANASRFFEATPDGIQHVELTDAPESIDDLMKYIVREKSLQFHTDGAGRPSGQRRSITFHGHGVGTDDTLDNKRLEEYCRMVSRSVEEAIKGSEAPLVLAADERPQAAFRQISGYEHLVDQGISSNPEQMDPEELHRRALRWVRPSLEAPLESARARFREAAGSGLALTDIPEAVRAGQDGRIETLFRRRCTMLGRVRSRDARSRTPCRTGPRRRRTDRLRRGQCLGQRRLRLRHRSGRHSGAVAVGRHRPLQDGRYMNHPSPRRATGPPTTRPVALIASPPRQPDQFAT